MSAAFEHGLPTFSVAVLSHRRPHMLRRVLDAMAQLDYPAFEIVVVGDQPSVEGYGLPDWLAGQVKYAFFDGANICRSRNLAVEVAAGEFIAFCDDDAIPEPDWLLRLARAFRFEEVGGVGGLVRCIDGVRVEWAGGVFDREAIESPMTIHDEMRVFDADSQVFGNEFIGTMGANSAFRREAILSVGGFDESFRYYLDETDLMLRLAEAGWDAALVRSAEVHHLREANAVRDRLRTPRNLHEIAASKAYFCRRHLPGNSVMPALERFRSEKIDELDPHLRLGLLRAADRDRFSRQIEEGVAEGLTRERTLPLTESAPNRRFLPFENTGPRLSVAIASGWGLGSIWGTQRLARQLAASGVKVTCLNFYSGLRRRSVRYTDGIWWHRGGTWRLDHRRNGKRLLSRTARIEGEIAQVHARRRFDLVLTPHAGEGAISVQLPGLNAAFHARSMPGSETGLTEAVAQLLWAAEAGDRSLAPAGRPERSAPTGLEAEPEPTTMPG